VTSFGEVQPDPIAYSYQNEISTIALIGFYLKDSSKAKI